MERSATRIKASRKLGLPSFEDAVDGRRLHHPNREGTSVQGMGAIDGRAFTDPAGPVDSQTADLFEGSMNEVGMGMAPNTSPKCPRVYRE